MKTSKEECLLIPGQTISRTEDLKRKLANSNEELMRRCAMILSSHLSADEFARLMNVMGDTENHALYLELEKEATCRCPWIYL